MDIKQVNWDNEKNLELKAQRNITFEDVVVAMSDGEILYEKPYSNQKKYPGQKIFIIDINNYAYMVPFVEDEEKVFLKTIIPSRKATKKYILKNKDI